MLPLGTGKYNGEVPDATVAEPTVEGVSPLIGQLFCTDMSIPKPVLPVETAISDVLPPSLCERLRRSAHLPGLKDWEIL